MKHVEHGRSRKRRLVAVLGVLSALVTTLLAGPLNGQAEAAGRNGFLIRTDMSTYAGYILRSQVGGFPVTYQSFDPAEPFGAYWHWGTESYIGHGGRPIAQLINENGTSCLSHKGAGVVSAACNVDDFSQWWSVEQRFYKFGSCEFCSQVYYVMRPFDLPNHALDVNSNNNSLRVTPFTDAPGQRQYDVPLPPAPR
ncbi:hypothetical protein OG474_40885 [Kribbella sp. NBC_01505]|uniref:hypothetical protein n=1 Tax=Kribbella sp. NBC_01505 TaxID=2903580 RepID=UPI00386A10A2